MFRIVLFGVCSTMIGFVLWYALYWYHMHAMLKHPIRDGYCTVEDLLIVLFVTGIMLGIMSR